jgi:OPA family sugar phosphate sensor protein UhpC-like MFS transporter
LSRSLPLCWGAAPLHLRIAKEHALNPRYERYRWQTFGITWLIYASLYLTRHTSVFGVAKVAFGDDPRVTLRREHYGWVDSTYQFAYMLGQFVFGPLGDRFGPRRILLVGLAVSVLASIGTGFSTTLTAFLAFAVLQGIGQSTGWPNTSKTMSEWFSLSERGRVIGWWCSHYTVGAAVAGPFAGWLMFRFGSPRPAGQTGSPTIDYWPAGFWGPAAVVAVILALTWLLLRNRPEDVGLPPIEMYKGERQSLVGDESPAEPAPEGSWKVIREVLSTPSIWMLGVAYFSIKLTRYAFYSWGPMYVSESLGSDAYDSSITAAAMPIGGLVGVVASGYISDKLFQARRAPVAILSLLITAAIMFIGLTPIHSMWLMRAFFFLVGAFLFGPDTIISATAAMDFGTKRGAGAATGFVNGVGSIGAILAGFLPGLITTESNWTPLFVVFLVGLVASAAMLTPLWNVKPPTR